MIANLCASVYTQVRSLNAQLPLTEAECDALLPTTTDAAARTLAHRYHRYSHSRP